MAAAILIIPPPSLAVFAPLRLCVIRGAVAGLALAISLTASASFAGGRLAQAAADGADGDALSELVTRGVELGEYRIRAHYPVQAQKSTVEFVLYAAVPEHRAAWAQRLIEAHRHKVRDQVISATRMTPLTVFDEPELTRFRRRILLRLRRTMPELRIDDVYVSDFRLMVQSL